LLDKYVLFWYDVFERINNMSGFVVVGGGWNDISSTGEKFIRIQFKTDIPEDVCVVMYRNKRAITHKDPDFLIYSNLPEEKSHYSDIFGD
jgi:hypothetical protein